MTTTEEIYRNCEPAHFGGWLVRQRKEGRSIGIANGCFDLLHPGHIHLLTEARKRCGALIVAVNGDESIKRLKGASRPVQNERERLLAIRPYADWACVFHSDTPERLIESTSPDVLFKGADSGPIERIPGASWLLAHGGRVELIGYLPGYSTTSIVSNSRHS